MPGTDTETAAETVRRLQRALDRERARNDGLSQGVSALTERVAALQHENDDLRGRLA